MASSAATEPDESTRTSSGPLPLPAGRIREVRWMTMDSPEARHEWDALALLAGEPNPFHESWYLLPALRGLDPKGTVSILRFEHGGVLAGLLPIRREPRYYRYPIPQLTGWMHGNCFLGIPLVAPGLEKAFWRALLAWTDAKPGAGLFLHLTQIPLTGPLWDALGLVLAEQGRAAGLVHREERAMLSSAQSPQDYFEASLSGKKRKELRRQHNRLCELGDVRFERSRDAQGMAAWTDQFLALEHSGWKGTAGSALASHHATTQLFKDALAGAAAMGRLERLTLSLEDQPIAMLASFITPPGAFSYKTAFDERFARFSPGVLLQHQNLALLADPEVQWCDSCAAADHPMIDHIWRERRPVGRISIAVGGKLRRALFDRLLRAELGRRPVGIS